jgi:hypothetical protein
MGVLRRITDGSYAGLSALQRARELAPALPWAGLAFVIDQSTPGSVIGASLLAAVSMVLQGGWPTGNGAFKWLSPEPGVWLTSPTRRQRRRIALLFPTAGLVCALTMAAASYWEGDALALGFDALLVLGFAVMIGWDAWSGLTVRLETRIDADGLYSRALGHTLSWAQIQEILPRRRGERFKLRLRVGPGSPGLPSWRRDRGGTVTVDLSGAGLAAADAIAALMAFRPDLAVHDDARPVETPLVLPIRTWGHGFNAVWEEIEREQRRFSGETAQADWGDPKPERLPRLNLVATWDEEEGSGATDIARA